MTDEIITVTVTTDKKSYVAGETVTGHVHVGPSAMSKSQGVPLCVSAVRLDAAGGKFFSTKLGKDAPRTFLRQTITLSGQPLPNERAERHALDTAMSEYITKHGRANPLTGVVLSTQAEDVHSSGHPPVTQQQQQQQQPSTEGCGAGAAATATTATSLGKDEVALDTSSSSSSYKSYPFSLLLPPWLPPSSYTIFEEARGGVTYTLTGIANVQVGGTADCGVENVKKEEHTQTVRGAVDTELIILSSLPKRELLQCYERACLKPRFSQDIVFHLLHPNHIMRLLKPAPVSTVRVRVTYLSSTTLILTEGQLTVFELLRDPTPFYSVESLGGGGVHEGGDGNDASSSPAGSGGAGTTVVGTVVGSTAQYAEHPHVGSGGHREDAGNTMPPKPISSLHLRLRIDNGLGQVGSTTGVDIEDVRVELLLRAKLPLGTSAKGVREWTLASVKKKVKISHGTSGTVDMDLLLPTRFRRSIHDKVALAPPPGVNVFGYETVTKLVVSFPSIKAVPEAVLPDNTIVLAEGVDLSDCCPYLPAEYSTEAPKVDIPAI